jgi:hypothetical protein
MQGRSGLVEALLRDHGARWSITVVATTLILTGLRLVDAPRNADLVAVAAVVIAGSAGLPLFWRTAAALVGWAMVSGFAYNRYGLLTFTKPDLIRMALLLTAAMVEPLMLASQRDS